jgi:phytoene synthase
MGDAITIQADSQLHSEQLLANCRTLEAWRGATARALLAGNPGSLEWLSEAACPGDLIPVATSLLPALADTAKRFKIPSRYLLDLIDGVLADQTQTKFHSFEQLEHYCYQVASTVGLSCIHIWQYKKPFPLSAAIDCGVAFQLTNILRDIREDADRGRVYLPREFWSRYGLSEQNLRDCEPTEKIVEVMRDLSGRAKSRYDSGWNVFGSLHPDGQKMFSMIFRTYRLLLSRIDADYDAALENRVRLTFGDRFRLVSNHFIGPLYRRLPKPLNETY